MTLTAELISRTLKDYYEHQANKEERAFPVRGSAMGHCPRKLSALLAKLPLQPLTAKAGRIFEDGHDRGISIGKALSVGLTVPGQRVELEREVWTTLGPTGTEARAIVARAVAEFGQDAPVRVAPNPKHHDQHVLQVRSRCDIVVIRDGANEVDLVECKGKGGWGYKKLDEEGAGVEYETQLAFQIAGLLEQGLDVRTAHFLFENKDTQEWKPIAFDMDKLPFLLATARMHADSILSAYALDGFTGLEGSPVAADSRLTNKLPWQCNYCVIGPKTGQCCPSKTLIDRRKPGANVPAWEAL